MTFRLDAELLRGADVVVLGLQEVQELEGTGGEPSSCTPVCMSVCGCGAGGAGVVVQEVQGLARVPGSRCKAY